MSITPEQRRQFLDEFLHAWPVSRLSSLTLPEYVAVGDKDTLAYWLEFGVGRYLGSIKGGDSSKFGIYERKAEPKGQRDFIASDSRYSWKTKYGASAKEAFAQIKNNILAVIEALKTNDVQTIETLDFEPALKWKLAFIYQDHANPCVLPIYKLSKFKYFLNDQPNYTHAQAYTQLLGQRGNESALEYGFQLWQQADRLEGKMNSEFDDADISTETEEGEMTIPLNQILYGPPGTGKTYETIRAALAILDPDSVADYDAMMQSSRTPAEKQNARQMLKARFDLLHHDNYVQFVTFHQSFSYEDFVEGIRAEADEVTKQVQYQVVDGVFKSLCELADVRVTKQAEAPVDLSGRRVWKMSLGNTLGSDASIYDECIENDCILLGYGDNIDFSACNTRAEIRAQFEQQGISLNGNNDYNLTSVNTFITKMKLGDLVVVSDGNFKFRAIAEITGDYEYQPHPDYDDGYAQKRKVKWLRQFTPSLPHSELLNGQFSQMTLYELKKPSLDKDKLAALLGSKTPTANIGMFSVGQVIGRDYKVIRVTPDLIELKKPNDNNLPFALNMLEELATAVRQGKITVEDIRKKTALDKLPGSNLEPFLVKGYPNVVAPLVQQMLSVESEKPKGTAPNARVLIIDEINRGNISRIFGELITLIEPSKRAGASEELEVVLPYSKKRFKVPSNLFIIGTMNTADRSLAGLDLALRRRFTFVEMPPQPELLDDVDVAGVNIGAMLRVMNQRITALLDRDHCIGHAYFMPLCDNPSLPLLADIFGQNILPLLQEYFFEDWQRIRWVLADQSKPADFAFIVSDEQMDAQQLFPNVPQFKSRECWRLNTAALQKTEAYRRIYQTAEPVTEQEA